LNGRGLDVDFWLDGILDEEEEFSGQDFGWFLAIFISLLGRADLKWSISRWINVRDI